MAALVPPIKMSFSALQNYLQSPVATQQTVGVSAHKYMRWSCSGVPLWKLEDPWEEWIFESRVVCTFLEKSLWVSSSCATLLQVLLFVHARCWSCTSWPACLLSFGLLAFPSRGLAAWFPRHRCSVTVVLDCEPGNPTMDLFQLLEVLLEARSQAQDALLSAINAFDVDIVEMPSISLLIHPQLSPDSRFWNVPCTYVLSGSGTLLERSCCVNRLVTK